MRLSPARRARVACSAIAPDPGNGRVHSREGQGISSSTDHPPASGVDDSGSSATALLRQVAVGDRAAFIGLYDQVGPAVYAIARGRRHDEPAASDLMHHVFLSLWATAPLFLSQDLPAESWILSIVARTLSSPSGPIAPGRTGPAPGE